MMKEFNCDDVGELEEFIGCKIVINKTKKSARLTHPVLLQSLSDEFELGDQKAEIPATAGTILTYKQEGDKYLTPEKQSEFRSGVGKFLRLTKWSRPESVCD
jgi:hypothetical protein